MLNLGPVITAMITPFRNDLSLNLDEAIRLAKHLEATGSSAILIAGTTGESPTLSAEERIDLYSAVRSATSLPIMVGIGTNSTSTTLQLLRKFENLSTPPDAYLVVTPYYNKPPQDALIKHFKSVADIASRPIMIYNIPSRTGTELMPRTIVQLAKHPNVFALKQAVSNLDRLSEIQSALKAEGIRLQVYSGDDSLTLPMLALGAVGVVSVASHIVGSEIRQMIESFISGNSREALEIHLKLIKLFRTLFITTNPIPVKTALALLGFKVNTLRPPLRSATEEERKAIENCMLELGLLETTRT